MILGPPPKQSPVDTKGDKISFPWMQWFDSLYNALVNAGMTLVQFGDSPNLDAFGRLRVSLPKYLFSSQFTNDLQPLLYEQLVSGSGASIAMDTTNRSAVMTLSATPTGGKSYMQTFRYFPFLPGKGTLVNCFFNFSSTAANVLKFVGYSDGVNGVEFQLSGTTLQFTIYSSSSVGNQTVAQSSWNLDKLDGTGTSGLTLDVTKEQILVMDFNQGRVRVGFRLDTGLVYAHQFINSNTYTQSFIATLNLPIRAGMTCTGTASTTMYFLRASVASEGDGDPMDGYEFSVEGAVTAASGAKTHILSIQKKTTFNGIANRISTNILEVSVVNTGSNPIKWELCIGDVLTGSNTFSDVNATYSGMQYNTAGTTSGSPAVIIDSDYVSASNQQRGSSSMEITSRYPMGLNAAGAVRDLGRYTLLVTGIGGSSACRATIKWVERR